MTLNAFFLLAL